MWDCFFFLSMHAAWLFCTIFATKKILIYKWNVETWKSFWWAVTLFGIMCVCFIVQFATVLFTFMLCIIESLMMAVLNNIRINGVFSFLYAWPTRSVLTRAVFRLLRNLFSLSRRSIYLLLIHRLKQVIAIIY